MAGYSQASAHAPPLAENVAGVDGSTEPVAIPEREPATETPAVEIDTAASLLAKAEQLEESPGYTVTFKHVFSQKNSGRIDDYYKFNRDRRVRVGEGSYGQVKLGLDRSTNAERAIKCIQKKRLKTMDLFDQETAIQQELDHPHIVKLYEVFSDQEMFYLVMELCTGGELFERITKAADEHEGKAFDEDTAACYTNQIFGAMSYLHSKHIAHRDVKPENFLMNSGAPDALIKMIDFGLAKKFKDGERLKTRAGTAYYVAPEVLKGSYDHRCDVWSCGILAYIFICGYPPFAGDNDPETLDLVRGMKFSYPPEDWDDVSEHCKELISAMLTPEIDDQGRRRPEFKQLLEFNWFEDHATRKQGKLPKDLATRLTKFTNVAPFKKIAATCIATQLKDHQIEDLKTSFEELDEDSSGTLTHVEIVEGLSKHGVAIPNNFNSTIAALDTDGSGVIDYTEFIAATLEETILEKEELMWAAFRIFDLDHDGYITKDELSKVSSVTDDKVIIAMISDADIDGDGRIDFEEFKAIMRR